MGKPRFVCEYCNKSFEDSQEARQRHNRGRNHKANVKLWYDSFADQERHAAASASASGHSATAQDLPSWTPVNPTSTTPATNNPLLLQHLPPSMHPAPPGAFYYCRSDWG
ncbi:zinc finger CCCH domain-containing protein 3 [Phytophthora cinnamomi]|uniref:zinc finger CCCH domain-containing protein 3 n=1 Tax=Phytophthora cinnamomi TaxID=4785 RepID=UPI00355A2E9D|nr:zinc finger CCCH domain-containing protein 3 [Phytophthora cinnamomi]